MLGLDRVIEEDWFARLYRDSYRRLVLVAYALTNDLGAAEELTQDAFARAFGRRAVLADADSPEAWVRAMVIYLAGRRAKWIAVPNRILRRRPSEPEPAAPADQVDPHAAVRALSEEHRRVLVLHHLGDLPVDDTASIMDVPVETVWSRLAEARAALAARLGTEVDDADLDARLAELKEKLRESVPEPELHQALVGSRQRVTRRRVRVGAVSTVVVVATAIPLLRTALRPVPDTTAATTPTTEVSTPAPDWYPNEPFITGIDFADTTHGYVVRHDCRSGRRCQASLLVTEDGEHWENRSLPEPLREPENPSGRLFVLGPREIVLGEWFPIPRSRTTRWYSDDAGGTWRELPAAVEETTESIPPGAILEHECPDPADSMPECRKSRLVITEPGSGQRVALANQPPLERMWPESIPAADGNWWVPGVYPGTDKWALAVSRNAGRHWTVAPMPDFQGRPAQRLTVSAGPGVLYVAALGELPDTPHGLLAILRSTDGGASWQQTWQAATSRTPRDAYAVVLAADGSLRVLSPFGKQFVSNDGGREFVEDSSRPSANGYPLAWVTRIKAGYLAQSVESPNIFRLSTDGLVWKDVNLPVS